MTKKQLARRCLRVGIERMKLTDWDIRLSFDEKLPHAADCAADPEYRQARIRLNPRRMHMADIPATIFHELDHCHVEDLAQLAVSLAKGDPVALEAIRKAEEGLVTVHDQILTPLLAPFVVIRPEDLT